MGLSSRFNRMYSTRPLLTGAIIGAVLGFLVISPIAMVLEHLTHTSLDTLGDHMRELFLLENPDWTIIFTLLGVFIGLSFGYLERRIDGLQRDLYQAEKLASVGQLAAGVAHEINTPLSNISINIETARMKCNDPALEEKFQEITHQVDIASKIVKDLLEYTSPAGTEMVDVDVNEVLRRVVEFKGSFRREEVRVVERYREDLPTIKGEPNQLQHAFSNLVSNAYDAMPDGGVLEITTDVNPKGCVVVDVRDTGSGIPADQLSHVFEPFFTTKDPGKGTGLGLSICQSIVRAHRGRVKVSSKVGEGTTVRVAIKR